MSQAIRRNIRCTQLQKQYLISFMTRHQDLGLNSFSHIMGHQRHMDLWAQLAQELSELGPSKTVEQWKITWRDLKSKAKSANAAVYRAHRKTGNNQNLPVLSNGDNAILSIIGKTSSEGLLGVPESGLGDGAPAILETGFATASAAGHVLTHGDEESMPTPHENFPSGPSTLTSRPTSNDEVPLPTEAKKRTRPSTGRSYHTGARFTRPIKKDLAHIYESGTNSTLAVLTEISNHMAVRNKHMAVRNNHMAIRNEVEEERNIILEKKNGLLERLLTQRFGPEEIVIMEDE